MELFEPAIRFFWEGEWPAGIIEPRRRLFDCELVFVAFGAFTLFLSGKPQKMTPVMIAVIPPAFMHESRADSGEGVYQRCVHFDWLPYRAQRRAPLQAWEADANASHRASRKPLRAALAVKEYLEAHYAEAIDYPKLQRPRSYSWRPSSNRRG